MYGCLKTPTTLIVAAVVYNLCIGLFVPINHPEILPKLSEFNSMDVTHVLTILNWFALLFLIVVVLAPIIEEFVFRGCLQRLLAFYNPAFALWFTACLFAAAHTSTALFIFIPAVIFGMLFQYHGLKASIAGHVIFNLVGLSIISFKCLL
jgi:membrane protease YdiL (CAAX protease family)